MGQPRPLFNLFSSFQTHHKFYNKYVKKCSSSIRCRDSNWRPLEHESAPAQMMKYVTREKYLASMMNKIWETSWHLWKMSDRGNQCDQMARLFFSIFGRLNSEILPYCIYFAKVDSKFSQLLKAPQTLPNVFKFCQSGKISPNLVTLWWQLCSQN